MGDTVCRFRQCRRAQGHQAFRSHRLLPLRMRPRRPLIHPCLCGGRKRILVSACLNRGCMSTRNQWRVCVILFAGSVSCSFFLLFSTSALCGAETISHNFVCVNVVYGVCVWAIHVYFCVWCVCMWRGVCGVCVRAFQLVAGKIINTHILAHACTYTTRASNT